MALHILLMNVAAPCAAAAMARFLPARARQPIAWASAVQLAALWFWHMPPVLSAAMHAPALHVIMQGSLFLAALWFWDTILRSRNTGQVRSIVSLLITSKLFCLLGVLLVFAPRLLYTKAAHMHGPGASLADQQLAGLLMLVACPATYVLAGIIIAARWLLELDRAPVQAGIRAAYV